MDKIQIEEERIRRQVDKKRKQIYLMLSVFALSVLTISYTVFNRPIKDFIQYSFFIALSVATLLLLFIIINWIKGGFAKSNKADIIFTLATFFIVVPIIGITYYSFGVSIKDTYLWAKSPSISKIGAVILTVVVTLLLALILFYFRLRYRSIYGMTEAIVGLTVAGNRVLSEYEQETFKSTFYLAILTAAVYLVVRGLDNIHQGLTKEPIDPIVSRLLKK